MAIRNGTFDIDLSEWIVYVSHTAPWSVVWWDAGRAIVKIRSCATSQISQTFTIDGSLFSFDYQVSGTGGAFQNTGWKLVLSDGTVVADELFPMSSVSATRKLNVSSYIGRTATVYFYSTPIGSCGNYPYTSFDTYLLIDNVAILRCPVTPKYSEDAVTLNATPKDGIGPYYVVFRKNEIIIDTSRLGGLPNPITNAPENTLITRVYTLDDLDISSALTGTIDFSVYMEDSCPTGAKTCIDTCTITIGCIAPVCNFTVT